MREYTHNELLLKPFKYDRNALRVIFEFPAGIAGGFVCAFAGGAIGAAIEEGHGFISDEAAIGILTGYFIGSSLGVYLVARGGNKDLSLGYTVL